MAVLFLRCAGWKPKGGLPGPSKLVIPAAPHTTNWDGVLLILFALELRADLRWLGKRQLFPLGLGWLMKWLGGIPVFRDRSTNLTEQAAHVFETSESLLLVITPEGTRSRVDYWKTGFYRIAQLANVPIALGYLDYENKTGGFGPVFDPALGVEMDHPQVLAHLDLMRDFYSQIPGLYPDRFGPVRFPPADS